MFCKILITFSVVLSIHAITPEQQKNKKIFCNYCSIQNSLEKPETSKAESLCTHIIYNSIGIAENGNIEPLNPQIDLEGNNGLGYIKKFNDKKKYNKLLKTLAGIYEHVHKAYINYGHILSDENNQKRFIKSTIDFLIKYNFNGLVFHWPFVDMQDGPSTIKTVFVTLLKTLKQEFSKKNLILVVICDGLKSPIHESNYIKDISENVDYIYLKSYNFYNYVSSSHIGISNALYLHPKETNKLLSADAVVSSWISRGVAPEKLLMGITFFGTVFTLRYKNQTEPYAQHTGELNKSLNAKNNMSYVEICQKINKSSWTVRWEHTQKNPYAFKGNQWVGFENPRSLEIKAKYVIDKKLAGVGISCLDADDNKGLCGEVNILLKELNTHLRDYNNKFEYILNSSVFKKSLDGELTQCVYHKTKLLDLEDLYLLELV